jgi:hypothetical protein
LFSKNHHHKARKPRAKGGWPDFRDAAMVAKLLEFGFTKPDGTKYLPNPFITKAWNSTYKQASQIIVDELQKVIDAADTW